MMSALLSLLLLWCSIRFVIKKSRMMSALLSLLLLWCSISESWSTPQFDATTQVLQTLQDPELYNNLIRPSAPGPTQVTVNTFIRHLDVDDVNMMLTVDMTFRMKWRDQRIRYLEPDVEHVTLTDYSLLWTPDPFFKQSLSVKQHAPIHKEAYVRIDRVGNIVFSTRFLVKIHCPMDLTRFPHDIQDCVLMIASYGMSIDDIVFHWDDETPIQQSSSIINADTYHVNRHFVTDLCDSKTVTGVYSCLSISMELTRVFQTYLINWYIPVTCLVFVALCSQLLPIQEILPRILITIAPLLTLYSTTDAYISKNRAPVPYTTAFDVFTGISFMVLFATLLHSIIGYYYVNRPQKEEEVETIEDKDKDSEIEVTTSKDEPKWHKVRDFILGRADLIARSCITGGYAVFIFLYLIAYSN